MTNDFPSESNKRIESVSDANQPESGPDAETIPPTTNRQDDLQEAQTIPPEPSESQEAETIPPNAPVPETRVKLADNTTHEHVSDSTTVPGYEILGELGRGGMGVVYKARHLKLNRIVALKMILTGGHAGSDDVKRFLSEAEAVAAFQHPNIVQVFDSGQHNNIPYMALEFVEGGSLADKLKNGPLSAGESAQLVERIAHGMNTAHQGGIVHRDLKPDNVLLTKDGTPKVTDFGLAKKVEGNSELTRTGAIMGTPSYMAPEQAGGEGKRVGPAADVYALGAVLYCCLAGRPPFQAPSPLDTILQVVSSEPTPLRQLNPKIPRDIETICLKCLEKEPLKRYASAEKLADELQRYLNDEPITARPVSQTERAFKWVKRNTALATALVTVFLVLILGAGISSWQAMEAYHQKQVAETETKRANENEQTALKQKKMAEQNEGYANRQADRARKAEKRAKEEAERAKNNEQKALLAEKKAREETEKARKNKNEALRQLDYAQHTLYSSHLDNVRNIYRTDPHKALKLLHDYRVCPIDRRCAIWRFYERQCKKWHQASFTGHTIPVRALCFSPDGLTLASASGSTRTKIVPGKIILRNVKTGKVKANLEGHSDFVFLVKFSPDGTLLASAGKDQTIKLWDVQTGREKATIKYKTPAGRYPKLCLRFGPDGKTLTVANSHPDSFLQLWDVKTGREITTIQGKKFYPSSLCFSPDGQTLATGSDRRENGRPYTITKLWDVNTGDEKVSFQGSQFVGGSMCFSPDGKTLASAGQLINSGILVEIKLWDTKTGREKATLKAHKGDINSVSFSPDGKTLASASDDGTIKLWDVRTGQEIVVLRGTVEHDVNSVVFGPDGKTLASGSEDKTVRIWNIQPKPERITFKANSGLESVSFSLDGRTLATSSSGFEQIQLWDVKTGREKPIPIKSKDSWAVSLSPDGTTLASSGMGFVSKKTRRPPGIIELWNLKTGKRLATFLSHTRTVVDLSFSPDGKTLASAGLDETIKLWDMKTLKEIMTLKNNKRGVWCVRFSPDGKTLASASDGDGIKLWDVKTGQEKANLKVWARSVGFSPDGQLLATAGNTIKLWDVNTGQEKATLKTYNNGVSTVRFSPDGNTLVATNHIGTVKLWDLSPYPETAKLEGHQADITKVRFSQDGLKLQSTDKVGDSLYWDLKTGQLIRETPEDAFLTPGSKGPNGKYVAEMDGRIIRLIDLSIRGKTLRAEK